MTETTVLERQTTTKITYEKPAFETIPEEEFFEKQVANVVSCQC